MITTNTPSTPTLRPAELALTALHNAVKELGIAYHALDRAGLDHTAEWVDGIIFEVVRVHHNLADHVANGDD